MAEKHSYTEEMEAEVKFFKKGQAISLNTDHNDHHHHMTSYCITIFQDWGQRSSWDAGDQDAGGHPQVKMANMMAMVMAMMMANMMAMVMAMMMANT